MVLQLLLCKSLTMSQSLRAAPGIRRFIKVAPLIPHNDTLRGILFSHFYKLKKPKQSGVPGPKPRGFQEVYAPFHPGLSLPWDTAKGISHE